MHLFGRTFTPGVIERIRAAVTEPRLTRSVLSRRVCGWLEWFGADGRPKEVSCRKALVTLERQGLITLPAAQRVPPQARPAPLEPFVAPVFGGTLAELGAVELVAVEGSVLSRLYFVDEARFAGTVYQAANWQRLGVTRGRGRKDRANAVGGGQKAVYGKKLRQARRREGRYLLRSNLRDTDPAKLWQYYIQLTEIEQAFKELKHDLA